MPNEDSAGSLAIAACENKTDADDESESSVRYDGCAAADAADASIDSRATSVRWWTTDERIALSKLSSGWVHRESTDQVDQWCVVASHAFECTVPVIERM